ncbi:MAG: ATP-binding cassette domain-containing protein [Clostridiales bacterium]|nr:ATP-binding cassette domain-containing protein [Clostridiales bacterium]
MLELQNISFHADDKDILKDINLKIDDKFVAITGPNGSGKSTLLKIIMGIITPTSGKIIFDGQDITGLAVNERANLGISFAFQQPVRFKGLKVKDLLAIAAGESGNSAKTRAYLKAVGLCPMDYLDREINDTLSGGEMKRIEIAMAAARGGKLSLFDEPEAGIDLWSFQSLIEVFENLRNVTNGNIMIISHQERILEIADKIIYLKDGVVDRYDESAKIMDELNMRRRGGCDCAFGQKGGSCNG